MGGLGEDCWGHSRAGIVLGVGERGGPAVVMAMLKLLLSGSDVFFALNEMRSEDRGRTWSAPTEHVTLGRWEEVGTEPYLHIWWT